MSLKKLDITGIIPVPDGEFKELLEENKDYFSCDEKYKGNICISNTHLVNYLHNIILS